MNDFQERLRDLSEIRTMMERSTKFISLSGLSGVSAGLVALLGAFASYHYLLFEGLYDNLRSREYLLISGEQLLSLIGLGLLIMLTAAGFASFFSIRLARKHNLSIWNAQARRMALNLLLPLMAGGIFCILLAWNGYGAMVAPATLVFYGLSLVNAGQFTLPEIRLLGVSEVILGLVGSFWLGYGLIIWAIGFGLLHILYGILLYIKYER